MPIYMPNHAWLSKSVESLKLQTLRSWKLVLSLDGEDPETIQAVEIVQALIENEDQLQVVQGGRVGISGTLNRGLAACNAPYTARLDADDICRPDRLEKQWLKLEANASIIACGMQIQRIDSDGLALKGRRNIYPTTPRATLLTGALLNTPVAHPTLMFRTAQIIKAGGYREIRGMEDYDLLGRICGIGNIVNLGDVGLEYRIHANQHSKRLRPLRGDLLITRLRFVRQLVNQRSARGIALSWLPILLYLMGPIGEYRARSLGSHLAGKMRLFTISGFN